MHCLLYILFSCVLHVEAVHLQCLEPGLECVGLGHLQMGHQKGGALAQWGPAGLRQEPGGHITGVEG